MPYPATITAIPVRADGVSEIIYADHLNVIRTALRDLNTVLGDTPQGALASLQARLATLIGTDGNLADFGQIKIVGKTGCKYTTIGSALAAISDASAAKPYTIFVLAGIYQEHFHSKPYVTIIGSGRDATIIKSPVNNNSAVLEGGNFENIGFEYTGVHYPIQADDAGTVNFYNCKFTSVAIRNIEVGAGIIYFYNCQFLTTELSNIYTFGAECWFFYCYFYSTIGENIFSELCNTYTYFSYLDSVSWFAAGEGGVNTESNNVKI